MHLFLSYAKSHIYELHALLAATIAFCIMFWVKKPIKAEIADFVKKCAAKKESWKKRERIIIRRFHIILIVLTFLISGALFGVLSAFSPLIHFSMKTMWLSGVLAITEYAVYEQLTFGRKKEKNE